MIKVAAIEVDSDAERAGILPGDKILKINEEEVRDRLDFEFHRSGEFLDFEIMRGEKIMRLGVERESGNVLGIEQEVMKIHLCKNNCGPEKRTLAMAALKASTKTTLPSSSSVPREDVITSENKLPGGLLRP